MVTAPKKIRRRRPPGEVAVEQTHDAAVIAAMLDRAGMTAAADRNDNAECFLMAYWGDSPVGFAAVETWVDAALMGPLFVLESMRRRGVGAALLRAVRVAAHTRGAQRLYASASGRCIDYLARWGFIEVAFAEIVQVFGDVTMLQRSNQAPKCRGVCLDISRDGLIAR